MKKIILLSLLIVVSCKTDNTKSVLSKDGILSLPEWAKNANVYEVNVRQFSDKGTFNEFARHLPRLKKMGVDILWLMPIHPISMKNRKAKGDLNVEDIESEAERKNYLGSPYSVANYTEVNPEFGTMEDFESLVSKTHELGMKIIIDWVPNHTGWDNPWITEHPEWYTQDEEGNIIDPIDYNTGESWGWTDVADLNYDNQDMRKEMIKSMQFWLDEADIDGFRVDVAHGIPQDFWNQMTPKLVDSKKDIFLLAESEVPSHRNENTYHATYGWSFHHLLNEIAKGEKRAEDIDKWYAEDTTKFKKGLSLMFTSNHDENTWAGTVFDRMGDAHKALAALTLCFEGIPLVYSGQEEPLRHRLKFFEKDNINFKNLEYESFYKKFLTLKHRNEALWNGPYGGKIEKIIFDKDVYGFKREKNGDVFIGVFNLSDERQEFNITHAAELGMTDRMTNKHKNWQKGMVAAMRPWQFYIFSNVE
jgi:glycosidase